MRQASPLRETPLSPVQRYLLIFCILGILLGCALVSVLMISALLVLLAVEALLFVVLLRIGLSGVVAPYLGEHFRLLLIFPRSLYFGRDRSSKVYLRREEAPRLFDVIDDYARRLAITPPQRIQLVDACTAWVSLKGWRKGAGNTTLGLGYELLAGLDEDELTAVIAHEMAHAKRVNRGFNQFHRFVLNRFVVLRSLLYQVVQWNRQTARPGLVALRLFQGVDRLCKTAARLAAKHSRQDEFEADALAATLAKPAALASSLERIPLIARNSSRISWSSRLTRLESGKEFASWLQGLLNKTESASEAAEAEMAEDASEAHDPYSTHPSDEDRIAALPAHEKKTEQGPSALSWFANPNQVARELITFQLADLRRHEREDLKNLRKNLRSWHRVRKINVKQWGAILVGGAGMIFSLQAWEEPSGLEAFAVVVFFLGAVAVAYRYFMPPDLLPFEFPSYQALVNFQSARQRGEDVTEREKALDAEAKNVTTAAELDRKAMEAFGAGDLLVVHVYSRHSIRKEKETLEAIVLHAVAAGAFGQSDYTRRNLQVAAERQGMRGKNLLALAGCAAWLSGNAELAETFLEEAVKYRSDPTLLAIQAASRLSRGKLHTALEAVDAALKQDPEQGELLHLKARVLLSLGRVDPARDILARLPMTYEPDRVLETRLTLAINEQDQAAVDHLYGAIPDNLTPDRYLALAKRFLSFEDKTKAKSLAEKTMAHGFYPEAHFLLMQLSLSQRAYTEAKTHGLATLATDKKLGPGAVPALDFFSATLGALTFCHREISQAKAWLFQFGKARGAGEFSGVTLLVYAADSASARNYLEEVVHAVIGSGEAKPLDWVEEALAPGDAQPEGSVRPGVQRIWSVKE